MWLVRMYSFFLQSHQQKTMYAFLQRNSVVNVIKIIRYSIINQIKIIMNNFNKNDENTTDTFSSITGKIKQSNS